MVFFYSYLMTTTGAPMTTSSAPKDEINQIIEYNIILYKKCNQMIILQYIHSIISILFVSLIIYVFYTILKNKKTI
jgi:hypothetical protein